MKLNHLEFLLMNNPIRAYVQEKYELPILMNMLASNTFDSVLEIGCGNGHGTKLIKKYFNPHYITAIDLDEKMIQIANINDPVFSPKGTDYGKWRGEEGERILALWLDQSNMKYERDLGKGIPDFLLKKSIKINGEDLNWIESKATFGDLKTRMKTPINLILI